MMSGNDSVCGPGYADVGQLGLQQGRPREEGKAPERGQLPGQAEDGAGHDGQRPRVCRRGGQRQDGVRRQPGQRRVQLPRQGRGEVRLGNWRQEC